MLLSGKIGTLSRSEFKAEILPHMKSGRITDVTSKVCESVPNMRDFAILRDIDGRHYRVKQGEESDQARIERFNPLSQEE